MMVHSDITVVYTIGCIGVSVLMQHDVANRYNNDVSVWMQHDVAQR